MEKRQIETEGVAYEGGGRMRVPRPARRQLKMADSRFQRSKNHQDHAPRRMGETQKPRATP
jgi:hypothetical protein